MGFASQPSQVPTQLVVQALDVMGMCFACRVLLRCNDALVGPVLVCAVLDVLGLRELLLEHPGGRGASVAQRKSYDRVAFSLYRPPQPDGLFFVPT